MRDVVIASAVRTATGKFQGTLKGFTAPQLGALVVAEAVRRAGVEPDAGGRERGQPTRTLRHQQPPEGSGDPVAYLCGRPAPAEHQPRRPARVSARERVCRPAVLALQQHCDERSVE